MGKELDVFLSSYSREAREIVLCLRAVVLNVLRGAAEQVNPKSEMITYSLHGKPNAHRVCAIAPHMKHVNLLLSHGAKIPDPHRLLVGSGEVARHVKIKSEAETQNPALQLLLEKALRASLSEDS